MYCYIKPKKITASTLGLLLIMLTILISITSCRKDKIINSGISEDVKIEDGIYMSDFDWNTTKVYEVSIKGSNRSIGDITSVNGQIRYHRGLYSGEGSDYKIKISLPKTVKLLMINQDTVSVNDSPIIHSIS